MTQQEKDRIIEIIRQHGELIGNDSEEADNLISKMQFIKAVTFDLTIEEEIQSELEYLSNQLGYVPSVENNRTRNEEFVSMRDAISRVVFDKFSNYGNLYHVLADYFEKDRTSILSMDRRTKNKVETKDLIFMRYYNKLIANLQTLAA